MLNRCVTVWVTVLSVLAWGSCALGVFNYGNLSAVNVIYQNVWEDSTTHPGIALFGTPSTSADALVFSPSAFGLSVSGGGIGIMDGTLHTVIQSVGNSRIEKVQFAERGDYTLAGLGTAGTSVAVTAPLLIRVLELDGVGVAPIAFNTNMVFTPAGGAYNLVSNPGVGVIWQGSLDCDVTAAIAAAGKVGKATKVDISLDNQLLAFSEAGTIAYIKKKQVEGVTITTVIPEPATVSLLVLGGLAAWRRRRE